MRRHSLKARTNHPNVDRALAEVVALLEERFAEQIRGHYLLGSWAYGDARTTSDVDLVIVFRAGTPPEIGGQARTLVDEYSGERGLLLGVFPVFDGRLHSLAGVQLRLDALHLYGEDIRAEIEPVSPAVWTRDRMHGMYVFTGISRGLTEICPPLPYPKPDEEFFGFTEERITECDCSPRQGTRDLVTGAGWYATALIAYHSGAMVVRKVDVPTAYERHVGDAWTSFLRDLFARCRESWNYEMPAALEDRRLLRELCARNLEFENHFLRSYRDFALGELRSADGVALEAAVQVVERLPYRDPEIEAAWSDTRT
jgi:predicted nucleotidyltransferase